MASSKLLISDFYLTLPSADHAPGDVWANIPVKIFGKTEFLNAVVITPSCDLAQGKSEVVNFIPLLPLGRYFFAKPFFNEAYNSVGSIFKMIGGIGEVGRFSLPKEGDIKALLEILDGDAKKKADLEKIQEYLKYVRCAEGVTQIVPDLYVLLGQKTMQGIIDKIIRNSYKSDLHFFPKMRRSSEFSIREHSVAMLRYIFTVDIEIINVASETSPDEWESRRLHYSEFEIYKEFVRYPVKICRLRDDFLSDFLARHLNMHLRFGSRDFSLAEVGVIREEINVSVRD